MLYVSMTYFIIRSVYLLILFICFTYPPTTLPAGNYLFVLCIYESVSLFVICLLVLFFRFHCK